MNPFNAEGVQMFDGCYSYISFVKKTMLNMEYGEKKELNLYGKNIDSVKASLWGLSKKTGVEFRVQTRNEKIFIIRMSR